MKQNFSSPQGADWVLNLAVTQAGVPKSLSGATLFMTLKTDKSLADTDTGVIRITPVVSATPSDGTAVATVPASTTIGLSGTYYYDVKVKFGDGTFIVLASGVVTFTSIVTNRIA